MEMPSANFMNEENITAGIAAGNITDADVDDSVFRILRSMFAVGVMDAPEGTWDWKKLQKNVTSSDSLKLARSLSAKSTVLLKNDGVLPLSKTDLKKIALIGFINDGSVVHGGGSGSVTPSSIVTALQGIQGAVGPDTVILTSDGVDIQGAANTAALADVAVVFVGTLSHEGGEGSASALMMVAIHAQETASTRTSSSRLLPRPQAARPSSSQAFLAPY